jgi:uncharacterized protein (TIGR02599 family)
MKRAGFTLAEVLVAAALVALLTALLLRLTSQSSAALDFAQSNAEEYRAAQRAFEVVSRRLGAATLQSYRGRVDGDGKNDPRGWQRMSELRFVSGPMQAGGRSLDTVDEESGEYLSMRPSHGVFFQSTEGDPRHELDPARVGLEQLVNTWGYFVEVAGDRLPPPNFLADRAPPERVRPRLMEVREPAAALRLYSLTSGAPGYAGFDWFRPLLARDASARPIATNIAMLLVLPKLTAAESARVAPNAEVEKKDALLAPEFFYNSGEEGASIVSTHHRLPPLIEITMLALDEAGAARLYNGGDRDPLLLREAFRDARKLRAELHTGSDSLERQLNDQRIRHRIFTTTLALRSAP